MGTITEEMLALQPLIESGIVFCPSEIDAEGYKQLAWALLYADEIVEDEIHFYVHGYGGAATFTLAFVDLLQLYPNVVGILTGAAYSAHSVIWAGCPNRKVTARGTLHVHNVKHVFDPNVGLSSGDIQSVLSSTHMMEKYITEIYASASNQNEEYWQKILQDNQQEFKVYTATDLINLGMATLFE